MQNAMWVFWTKGYYATSVDDLVKATGVARSGIYSEFGGKAEAFQSCLAHYRKVVAGPAIAILNDQEDGLQAIRQYFSYFIDKHRQHGLPGPGCFIANVVTEVAPHSEATDREVSAHKAKLQQGFKAALRRAVVQARCDLSPSEIESLANFLTIASQGLWSYARTMHELTEIENFARDALVLVEAKLSPIQEEHRSDR